jgi:signal transduction histidine kinase
MIGRQERASYPERFRISQDSQDDLGARLTAMPRLSDLTQRGGAGANGLAAHGRLSSIAREPWEDLNSIIWAVNPYRDSTKSLAAYIVEHAKKYFGMSSIRCRMEAPEEFPHWSLSSDVRHNLFLVVKEALTNIVKHSQASEGAVSLQSQNSTSLLIIRENGRGFSRADNCVCGNGLPNIETRSRAIGGRFELCEPVSAMNSNSSPAACQDQEESCL